MATPLYRPGQRIEVVHCADEDPIPAGATGTVERWAPAPINQLNVTYDPPYAHRTLALVVEPGADSVRVIG